ncbi:glycerol-3-phosphate acyltransferase [Pseudothermotoga sp.]
MGTIVAILLGYLLGSFLPAYFITKMVLGVDIRELGTKHAGTTNVYRNVGLWPALLTALYDTSKGILAFKLASILNFSEQICFLSAMASVAGHVFPFYLQFRGGRGAATTVGILLYFLWTEWLKLPFGILLSDLSALALIVLVLFTTSRRGDVVGLFVLPALALLITLRIPDRSHFIVLPVLVLLTINLYNIIAWRLIKFREDVRPWRVLIRPAAFLLLVLGYHIEKTSFMLLISLLIAIFLVLDLLRLSHRRIERFFHDEFRFKMFKEAERKRLSSMTLFLLGVTLSYLFFEDELAIAACSFQILGDLAAKIIGMNFGKRKLFHKTVEGTLAHLMLCIYTAYVLHVMNFVPLGVGMLGAIAATICEVLPLAINDNVSVPLFSGIVMNAVKGMIRG